jgi:hypothetical protein
MSFLGAAFIIAVAQFAPGQMVSGQDISCLAGPFGLFLLEVRVSPFAFRAAGF